MVWTTSPYFKIHKEKIPIYPPPYFLVWEFEYAIVMQTCLQRERDEDIAGRENGSNRDLN